MKLIKKLIGKLYAPLTLSHFTYDKNRKAYSRLLIISPLIITGYTLFENGYSLSKNSKEKSLKAYILQYYENNLKRNSNPEKIFKYFSTLIDKNTKEIYMTPEDFVCALTMNWPENHRYHTLNEFQEFDKINYIPESKKYDSFYKITESGLISYPIFLLLQTLIRTPSKSLELGFKVMDINDDGFVSYEEFSKYLRTLTSSSELGHCRYDLIRLEKLIMDNVIMKHYFMIDELGFIRLDQYMDLCKNLKLDFMRIQFDRFEPINGKISKDAFVDLITCYASPRSVKRRSKNINLENQNFDILFTFDDYVSFCSLFESISDFELALRFIHGFGEGVDKKTLKMLTKKVANISLGDHLIDVVFEIFDANNDGTLSDDEFIRLLKESHLKGHRKSLSRFIFS